jgi:hypothetical protein
MVQHRYCGPSPTSALASETRALEGGPHENVKHSCKGRRQCVQGPQKASAQQACKHQAKWNVYAASSCVYDVVLLVLQHHPTGVSTEGMQGSKGHQQADGRSVQEQPLLRCYGASMSELEALPHSASRNIPRCKANNQAQIDTHTHAHAQA